MKFLNLYFFTSFLMCTTAFAATDPNTLNHFPPTLSCEATFQGVGKINFDIIDLNTKSPDVTNIPDVSSGLYEFEVNPVTTLLSVTNECDNYYAFLFFTEDLINLKTGLMKNSLALSRYFNADSENDPNDEPAFSDVSVSCKIGSAENIGQVKTKWHRPATCSTHIVKMLSKIKAR